MTPPVPVAPPQVGVPVTKDSLNAKLGAAAQSLKKSSAALNDLADWSAGYDVQALIDLFGFTQTEAEAFKGCCSEATPVAQTVDALAWMPKAWGA